MTDRDDRHRRSRGDAVHGPFEHERAAVRELFDGWPVSAAATERIRDPSAHHC